MLRSKPLKEAVRKLRRRIKITFEKEEVERRIAALERSNNDLKRIRAQFSQLQAPQCCAKGFGSACFRPEKPPAACGISNFGAVRRVSKSLYEALSMAWARTPNPQARHSVRLFLNAEVQEGVQMEVVILCDEVRAARTGFLGTGLVPLQVQSRASDAGPHQSGGTASGLTACGLERRGIPVPNRTELEERPRVRFAQQQELQTGEDAALLLTGVTDISTVRQNSHDTRLSGHFCPELGRQTSDASSCKVGTCLGQIEDPGCSGEGVQHWLYFNQRIAHACSDGATAVTVENVFVQPVHNCLTIVGQLRLALQLTMAVLNFSSTPWMSDVWTVQDVAFFRRNENLMSSLDTLHLNAELAHQQACQGGALMGADAQDKHGIRNMMLYSLGVALLAIGRWERVEPQDVQEVRRMVSQPSYLGPRYKELTEKVLDCDFGQGKDLEKPKLQEAVYESVILELETMIAGLDLGRR
jgi:hypothetical protein